MNVHVQRASSEVEVAPEPAATEPEQSSPWQEADRLRAMSESRLRDVLRTSAEGYHE